MKKATEKFLEFNGKTVYFLAANGTYWIAVKPLCEALGVDYEAQRKAIHRHPILSRAPSEQTVHDRSGRLQKMLCLPEKFVYGWLFSIESTKVDLSEYQLQCYELLFDYFHGAITNRESLLNSKTHLQIQIEQLENKILQTEDFQKLKELKAKERQVNRSLKEEDRELMGIQMTLWEKSQY
jgi:hypothetical protein